MEGGHSRKRLARSVHMRSSSLGVQEIWRWNRDDQNPSTTYEGYDFSDDDTHSVTASVSWGCIVQGYEELP